VLYDWKNRFATHQPVLAAAVAASAGPIAEFGCGHASTPLIHRLAEATGRRVVTLDRHEEWLHKFSERMETPRHEFRVVDDWVAELDRSEWSEERWGVIFIDQDPFDARAETVRRLAGRGDYIVVHDCDYFPRVGLFGREIAPLNGPADRGERDYGDVFRSWCEFFPPEPWPYRPTGPPTLLGSNVHDVSELRVTYTPPLWWRLGRHARAAVPRPVRMRVANLIDWGTSRYDA
jgi:hypothetical protein